MGFLDRFRKKKAGSSLFAGWTIKDIVDPWDIRKVSRNGVPNICVDALDHFEEYTEMKLLDDPYAPNIGGGDTFKLYFFPTFCVAEFHPDSEDTIFVVFSPDEQSSPLVAKMIVGSLMTVALGSEADGIAVHGQAADFLQANLPPKYLG